MHHLPRARDDVRLVGIQQRIRQPVADAARGAARPPSVEDPRRAASERGDAAQTSGGGSSTSPATSPAPTSTASTPGPLELVDVVAARAGSSAIASLPAGTSGSRSSNRSRCSWRRRRDRRRAAGSPGRAARARVRARPRRAPRTTHSTPCSLQRSTARSSQSSSACATSSTTASARRRPNRGRTTRIGSCGRLAKIACAARGRRGPPHPVPGPLSRPRRRRPRRAPRCPAPRRSRGSACASRSRRVMLPPVDGGHPLRVCLLGAESTGKSTLAEALAAAYETLWVAGIRPRLHRGGAAGGRAVDERRVHAHRADAVLAGGLPRGGGAREVLFCDTDAFTTAVFHEAYLGRAGAGVRGRGGTGLRPLPRLRARRPWERDGLREFEAARRRHHETYLEHARESGAPWLLVEGSAEQRLGRAQQAVDALLAARRSSVD